MAISTGAAIRRMAAWFALGEPKRIMSNDMPAQEAVTRERNAKIRSQDEEETQRVRKVGHDLMKYQGVNRGY